jgi:CheY-like chemotaxis protein
VSKNRPFEIEILIVEDNPLDATMTKLALKKAGFLREPTVVDDGGPALSLLSRTGSFQNHQIPDVVILDLNLRQIDGPEVLDFIRREETLKNLFVAILSSSPVDIISRDTVGADCYFSKPIDLNSYMELGREILNRYVSSDRYLN